MSGKRSTEIPKVALSTIKFFFEWQKRDLVIIKKEQGCEK